MKTRFLIKLEVNGEIRWKAEFVNWEEATSFYDREFDKLLQENTPGFPLTKVTPWSKSAMFDGGKVLSSEMIDRTEKEGGLI